MRPLEEERSRMWVSTWMKVISSMRQEKGKQYDLDPFQRDISKAVILEREPIYKRDPEKRPFCSIYASDSILIDRKQKGEDALDLRRCEILRGQLRFSFN